MRALISQCGARAHGLSAQADFKRDMGLAFSLFPTRFVRGSDCIGLCSRRLRLAGQGWLRVLLRARSGVEVDLSEADGGRIVLHAQASDRPPRPQAQQGAACVRLAAAVLGVFAPVSRILAISRACAIRDRPP